MHIVERLDNIEERMEKVEEKVEKLDEKKICPMKHFATFARRMKEWGHMSPTTISGGGGSQVGQTLR